MNSIKRLINETTFAAAFAVLTILILTPVAARAQWSTGESSNDIRSTNSGNVGVGTTTPPSKLTVSVTNNADGVAVDGTNNPMFSLKSSGVAKAYFGLATTVGGYVVGASPGDITLRSQGGKLFFDTNSGVGTPALTILGGNGGVGIGTSTPANALHVHSALGAQAIRVSGNGVGFINFMDTSAPANQKLYQWRSEGGLFRMALANDSELSLAQQNLLVANSAGNIGIGTASPTSKLHVVGGSITVQGATGVGAGNADFAIRTASANGYWDFSAQNTNGSFVIYDALHNKMPVGVESDAPTNTLYLNSVGAVGVGAPPPVGSQYKLVVSGSVSAGSLNVTGAITGGTINATYQDVAEWVPSTQRLSAGTVVVLDTEKTNHVLASTKVYDTGVAGVVSDCPGVILGVAGEGKLKVATTGRVKVKVDATRGAIEVGDLLVTSDVEGVAMKSVEVDLSGVKLHRPGTIIGKALEPLANGTGEILVLLSLQ
jgi:hypothetical protein